MIRLLYLLVILIIASCSKQGPEISLFKQWHLSPHKLTDNIEESKKLDQYRNQLDLYLQVEKMILEDPKRVIIAEGCEGDIDKNFNKKYNGWDLKKLQGLKNEPFYKDIMAPVPMKIKAKYENVKVICGDDLSLIKKNQLAFSDARGFTGFFNRLKSSIDSNTKKYGLYLKQLKQLYPKEDIGDGLSFSLNRALNAVDRFEKYVKLRNDVFIDKLKESYNLSPILIIGGLHVQDIEEKLTKLKLNYKTYTPDGYTDNEQALLRQLKNNLLKNKPNNQVFYFQVPKGFRIEKFKTKNLLNEKELFSEEEKREIFAILNDYKIDKKILLSDFDQDGIRDFTLSKKGRRVIIAAEDTDWDNDGIDNLLDSYLGEFELEIEDVTSVDLENTFQTQSKDEEVIKNINKLNINLLKGDYAHELFVLELFLKLQKFIPKHNVKYLKAVEPVFSYGDNVFFSYVKHTQTLEYYPRKLKLFLVREYRKRFKGLAYEKFVNQYVSRLLIHSLAHEIAHSIDFSAQVYKDVTWVEKPFSTIYLKSFRHPDKKIETLKVDYKFLKRKQRFYQESYKVYKRQQENLLKKKDLKKSDFKQSEYYSGVKTTERVMWLSFLRKYNLPSLYAITNEEEWISEKFSMCIFKTVFPEASKPENSVKLEHLLGINPSSVDSAFCKTVGLKSP